jgi:hypothetical protein
MNVNFVTFLRAADVDTEAAEAPEQHAALETVEAGPGRKGARVAAAAGIGKGVAS